MKRLLLPILFLLPLVAFGQGQSIRSQNGFGTNTTIYNGLIGAQQGLFIPTFLPTVEDRGYLEFIMHVKSGDTNILTTTGLIYDPTNSVLIGNGFGLTNVLERWTNVGSAYYPRENPDLWSLGLGSAATGPGAIAIGENTLASGFQTIAIGYYPYAEADYGIAVGYDAWVQTDAGSSIAIGASANVESENTIVIGPSSEAGADADRSITIGYQSIIESAAEDSIVIGPNSLIETDNVTSIAIGAATTVTGDTDSAIAIGPSSNVSGDGGVAIGNNADVGDADQGVAIGADTVINGGASGSVALGHDASVAINANDAVAIKGQALAPFDFVLGGANHAVRVPGTLTGNGIGLTNVSAAGLFWPTNAGSTASIDLAKAYAAFGTNNNVSFSGLLNVNAANTNFQSAMVFITNSTAAAVTITMATPFQNMNASEGNTLYCTNLGMLLVARYPGLGTNFFWKSR